MNKKSTRQSLTGLDGFRRKFSVKDPTFCPNCSMSASGFIEINEKFGLRTMDDGVIRV